MVINSGAITGVVDARTTTKEELGLLMTKTDTRPAEGAAEASTAAENESEKYRVSGPQQEGEAAQ